MSDRIVYISRSRARRALQRLYEEINPQFLIDFEGKVPDELVDKVVGRNGSKKAGNKPDDRSRRTRESLPYRPRTGVSTALIMRWIEGLHEANVIGQWDEWGYDRDAVDDISETHGFDQFELDDVPRYLKRKETSNGGWSYISEEQRRKYAKVNASIDTSLARGENPFRPENTGRHPNYFYR